MNSNANPNPNPEVSWDSDSILEVARSYQGAAVLAAAVDLDLFVHLSNQPSTAEQLASVTRTHARGMVMLLDALAALKLVRKSGTGYDLAPELKPLLATHAAGSVLAMAQHQANCMRRWARLAEAVRQGTAVPVPPSVRGAELDLEAFIGAMDNVSAPVADSVIRAIEPLDFRLLLDVGGGSGTWALAFLRACAAGRAVLFDLPEVVPLAVQRATAARLQDRVTCVPGDYLRDDFPPGADLAWVSAIVHQNSRAQNRLLFGKAFGALVPGGRIAIRDILMNEDRVTPVAGALFAVNMLVGTEGGGTFTFEELRGDLQSAGFREVRIARREEGMNSIVLATRP